MIFPRFLRPAAIALPILAAGCGSGEGAATSGSAAPAPSAAATSSGSAAATGASSAAPASTAAAGGATPDAVGKSYLQLGAGGDLSKIRDIVDPKCHATKVGDVDAVKMLGARMTLSDTTTAVESEEGDTAKVKYTVKGSVDAKGVRTETDIFGKSVEIKAGSMTMSGVSQSGVLTLKKIDGRWVVSC